MKLIVRADDVGYTKTHNDGTFETIEKGITTACDLMLDCPGFEDACERLKQYPWISIGWHTHLWGRPVLDVDQVRSMVDESGRFKWRKNKSLIHEVDYDEAVKECRAQIERCYKLLGRIPTTWSMHEGDNPVTKAIQTVCDEYDIAYDFIGGKDYAGNERYCSSKYIDAKIVEYLTKGNSHVKSLKNEDIEYYHPADALMDLNVDDNTWLFCRHPGFLDNYVLSESSCQLPRVKDVDAYCDPKLIPWIRENRIELVNQDDALFGTNGYQEHLKEINSKLYVG